MNFCEMPQWQVFLSLVLAQLLYMCLEAWLGKTSKVESGSVLELIWRGTKALFIKGEK